MNILQGTIQAVEVLGSILKIQISIGTERISTLLMDSQPVPDFLQIGNEVSLLFKEIDVIVAKSGPQQLSIPNQLACQLTELEKGSLFSKLKLRHDELEIVAIVDTKVLVELGIEEGDQLIAMIKANDLILAK